MLQIELIGNTEIRAHDLHRKESGTWLLVSQANMAVPLEHPSNKTNTWTVPPHFWQNIPLPSTVVPTFKTCNMSRTYELEVRVGLTHGMADGKKPEIIVSPIRLAVEVWSGMRPPQALLDQMEAAAAQRQSPQRRTSTQDSKQAIYNNNNNQQSSSATGSSSYGPPSGRPPTAPDMSGGHDLPPPSYEDAMANDLTPIDGPRPSGYSANNQQPPAFNPDSKLSVNSDGLNRRVSERLFSQNAPRAPRSSTGTSKRGRVVSLTEDPSLARFNDDIVHEEPGDINSGPNVDMDELTSHYGRQSLGHIRVPSGSGSGSGHGNTDGYRGYHADGVINGYEDNENGFGSGGPKTPTSNSMSGSGWGKGDVKGKGY